MLNKISSRAPASQIGAAGGGGGKSDMSFLDLLGSVGFDQPYFEGGGQRGATGIRRLVFPTDISVAVGTDPLNPFSGGRHIIKGVGFDRNGKVYFRVQDEYGAAISEKKDEKQDKKQDKEQDKIS